MEENENMWQQKVGRRKALLGLSGALAGASVLKAEQDPPSAGGAFRDHQRVMGFDEMKSSFDFDAVFKANVPQQVFDTDAQMKFCENLSFSPWHCLDAHRPLGGLNRLRRVLYQAISSLRHDINHAERKEPVDFSIE